MRFQELRGPDGATLTQGLHPSLAVVAAGPVERAAATSTLAVFEQCRVIHGAEVENQLQKASALAAEHHQAAMDDKKAKVADARGALDEAAQAAAKASRESSVAAGDLARFDQLTARLSSAEDAYEEAVRADAEAARSLAAALGELDKILVQRRSASSSLDQARQARERGVPEAVIQQAIHLQAALAQAEADRQQALRQADASSQASRAGTRDALARLESEHRALRDGMALLNSGAPDWGPGVPLPGLLANFRGRLAAAVTTAEAAETLAKDMERTAAGRLDAETRELSALESAGAPVSDPTTTISNWLDGEDLGPENVVVADEAFRGLGAETAGRLLSALASRGCQVIYLTDDPDVLGWAISLPREIGGASTISKNRAPKPALI